MCIRDRIQADIYQVPVVTMSQEEGTAVGAAILAAVGCGDYPSIEEGCKAFLQVATYTQPNLHHAELYNQYYHTYRNLYQHLKEDFAQQDRVVKSCLGKME